MPSGRGRNFGDRPMHHGVCGLKSDVSWSDPDRLAEKAENVWETIDVPFTVV
jgi:hypothetical protein